MSSPDPAFTSLTCGRSILVAFMGFLVEAHIASTMSGQNSPRNRFKALTWVGVRIPNPLAWAEFHPLHNVSPPAAWLIGPRG